eukprot:350468-Chlamydomonas_euryale.AAC.11
MSSSPAPGSWSSSPGGASPRQSSCLGRTPAPASRAGPATSPRPRPVPSPRLRRPSAQQSGRARLSGTACRRRCPAEYSQEVSHGDDTRVKRDLHDLSVAGASGAHLLVAWGRRVAGGVPALDLGHAPQLRITCLQAPEAAAALSSAHGVGRLA